MPPRRVVGLELHDLGHERARPGLDRRPAPADRDHAREPADGGRHPAGVRRARAPLRGLVRRHPGRPTHVPHVRIGERGHDRARAGRSDSRLVRGGGRALDRGRPRRRAGAHGAVGRRARDRLRGPARDLLGAGPRATLTVGVGRRDLALRRALPALRDHRPRRDDRDHRRDDFGARDRPLEGHRVRTRVPLHCRALVAVLRLRRDDRGAATRAHRPPDRARARCVHIPARGDRRRDRADGRR